MQILQCVILVACTVIVSSMSYAKERKTETPDIEVLETAQKAAQTLQYFNENDVLDNFLYMPPPVDFTATNINMTPQINLGRGRTLACEALLCAVGVLITESRPKCLRVLRDWSIYLATLSIFRSTPKCPSVNASGHVTGYNEMTCEAIQDVEMRNLCLEANNLRPAPVVPPRDPCDHLEGFEREICLVEQCRIRNPNQVCQIQ